MRRLLSLVLLLVLSPAPTACAGVRTGRLLVLARPSVRIGSSAVPEIGLRVVRPPAGVPLARAAAALRERAGVESVTPEQRAQPRRVPSDPALSTVDADTGVPIEWWAAREGFPAAWSLATGRGVRVGIIDTGIDMSHPELRGKIAAAVIPRGDASPRPAGSDQNGHGTHVASLACGATGNGIGLAAAGFDCSLVVEKVDFSDASIAAAIVDATKRGVRVLNMSFGADGREDPPAPTVRALHYAVRHGVVLIAAVADSADAGAPVTEQGDPASVLQPRGTGPRMSAGIGLSVTAADYADRRPYFAGSGTEISLAAYGAYDPGPDSSHPDPTGPPGIFGAFPAGTTSMDPVDGSCSCRTTLGGQPYAYLDGTSAAAPQVAGAAALIRGLNPDLGPLRVVRLLKETARRSGGWNSSRGWGVLDAGRALRAAARIDARPPVSTVAVARRAGRRVLVLRLSGHDSAPSGVRSSGIAGFALYAARRDAGYRLLARTRRRLVRVRLRSPGRYRLIVRAVDRAGNREPAPRRADLHIQTR